MTYSNLARRAGAAFVFFAVAAVAFAAGPSTTVLVSAPDPSLSGQTVTLTATVSGAAPAGTVNFFDTGNSFLGSGVLTPVSANVSKANFSTSGLAIGVHNLSATYGGDLGNFASTGLDAHTVQTNTTTSVTSNPNPSVSGQTVTLTATVNGDLPTLSGIVQFFRGPTLIGNSSLVGASANFSTSSLNLGNSSITAAYLGNAINLGSVSSIHSHFVKASSSLALTSSPDPSLVGQSVVLTANVTGVSPTGTVQFFDGATPLGAFGLTAINANLSRVNMSTSGLPVGLRNLSATYSGDVLNGGSTGLDTQTVQTNTTTSVTSNPNPSLSGQTVTLTATVNGDLPTLSGIVQFFRGPTLIGNSSLVGATANFSTSSLNVGSNTITAAYLGNAVNLGSVSNLHSHFVKATSSTSLTSSPDPSLSGQSVLLEAFVTGVAPSGTVEFFDGLSSLGTFGLTAINANLSRTNMSTSGLPVGLRNLSATYSGDGANGGSTGFDTQTVRTNTTTSVTSNPNPSLSGQTVTLTATVNGDLPTLSGIVQFFNGPTPIGNSSLVGASANFSTSSLSVGNNSITAAYLGNSFNLASISGSHNHFVKANSTTTLSTSPNPSVYAQTVTLTANVFGSIGAPTGTVQFFDGATPITTQFLTPLGNFSTAIYATPFTSVGNHSLSAVYSGSGSYDSSTSNIVNQLVTKGTPTVLVASLRNPGDVGDTVTFNAVVADQNFGGTPSGTVTLNEGITPVCSGGLSGGLASCGTSNLSAGVHSITPTYSGDANYFPVGGSPILQTIIDATALVAGDIKITEFRFGGSNASVSPAQDEYIELLNAKGTNITVGADGLRVYASSSGLIGAIPAGTFLNAADRFLLTNSGGYTVTNYGLGNISVVGTGDLAYSSAIDIAPDEGIGVFQKGAATFANRLDAVGFSSADPLYREGAGLTPVSGISATGEYAFIREMPVGVIKDTGDNAADFRFIATDGGLYSGAQATLGAPGPQSTLSPRLSGITFALPDPTKSGTTFPNRTRVGQSYHFRWKITNNTGASISQLRIRVATMTTLNSPGYSNPAQADFRLISTTGVHTFNVPGPATVTAINTVLEEPPSQPVGGGRNSSVWVPLSSPLAPGASVYINVAVSYAAPARGGAYDYYFVGEGR